MRWLTTRMHFGKRLIACTIVLSWALGAAVKAETIETLPYWPNDGIWIHYSTEVGWEVGIWVYCGYACTEWANLYEIPPSPSGQWVHDTTNHNSYSDHPFWYGQISHFWGDDYWESFWWGNAMPVWDCGDARSALNQEYVNTYSGGSVYFSLGILPHCTWVDGDFNSSGGSTNFSWSELNGGFSHGNPNYPWGIARQSLVVGLEQTRTLYDRGGITLSGGYRTPSGNAYYGGVFGSYHVQGRAADMYSANHTWTETEFTLLKDASLSTSPMPVQTLYWDSYTDHHFHAAW